MEGQPLGNVSTRQVMQPAMSESVVKWRLETEQAVRDYEAVLLGKRLDDNGRYIDPPEEERKLLQICNGYGVAFARMMLKLANKNTIQANIDTESLQNIMYRLADTITEKVGKNYHHFGITGENRDTYIDSLLCQLFLILTRPLGDLEREHTISQGQEKTALIQRMADYIPSQGGGPNFAPRDTTRFL